MWIKGDRIKGREIESHVFGRGIPTGRLEHVAVVVYEGVYGTLRSIAAKFLYNLGELPTRLRREQIVAIQVVELIQIHIDGHRIPHPAITPAT